MGNLTLIRNAGAELAGVNLADALGVGTGAASPEREPHRPERPPDRERGGPVIERAFGEGVERGYSV
jgi:hypothetical protein